MSCLHFTPVLFIAYTLICVIQSGMVMKNVEDSDYVLSDDVDTVKAEKILQWMEDDEGGHKTSDFVHEDFNSVEDSDDCYKLHDDRQVRRRRSATSSMMIDKLEDE